MERVKKVFGTTGIVLGLGALTLVLSGALAVVYPVAMIFVWLTFAFFSWSFSEMAFPDSIEEANAANIVTVQNLNTITN